MKKETMTQREFCMRAAREYMESQGYVPERKSESELIYLIEFSIPGHWIEWLERKQLYCSIKAVDSQTLRLKIWY